MATRKIKDAKDLSTNELIYFKGHAQATYMSNGATVEDVINTLKGGSGGVTSESDPVFLASPAASITANNILNWNNKQDLITDIETIRAGAGLGSTALQSVPSDYVKREELSAYTPIGDYNYLAATVSGKQSFIQDLDDIRAGANKGATAVQPDSLATVATSGSYNDLTNKPTIPASITESSVSGWGFTKNAGTITGVSVNGTSVATSGVANIPAASTSAYGVTKLSSATNSTSTTEAATPSAVKAAYDLANSYKGTVTGVKINGSTKSPSSGTVDIGNVATTVKIDNVSKTPSSGTVDLGYINKRYSGITSSSVTLSPNIYYRNTSTSLSSFSFTLGSVSNSSIINEYFIEFTTSSSGTTVSLPSGIKWMNGVTPTFEASTTYQISIVNNLGTWVKFK